MCLIAFAWRAHPELDLIVAANRDEFHARPTEAAHWWQQPAEAFGGRDLQAGGAWCAADRHGRFAAVTNVHAISNGCWGDHWPKTEAAQSRLRGRIEHDDLDAGALFELLADTDVAAIEALPDTGVGAERERFLSPLFIRSDYYGTRASTVIKRRADGSVAFHERGFDANARPTHAIDESWTDL
jgi:uncharacterized protein with NRDE domain